MMPGARHGQRGWLLALLGAVALLALGPATARAEVSFYTDSAAWNAAVGAAAVESFDTTPANLALADELVAPPGFNQSMGTQLTFRAPNTGLCGGFTLRALEPGATLVHQDLAGGAFWGSGTVSIGQTDSFDDDDFAMSFPTDSFFAVGFYLVDTTTASSEWFRVYGAGGQIGALNGNDIPSSSPFPGSVFVGAVATEPITSVRFDESSDTDDIAIRDLAFGCAAGDPDADDLSNLSEARVGTNPGIADSDGDGLSDGEEVASGTFGSAYRIASRVICRQSGQHSRSAAEPRQPPSISVAAQASAMSIMPPSTRAPARGAASGCWHTT